jgi:hypothetical protein
MSDDGEPTTCLVECYWPGVTERKVLAAVERVQAAIEQRHRYTRAPRLLASIFVPDDETVFCLFEGEHDEVEAVSNSAALPFERIVGSRWMDASRRFPNGTNV